MKYLTILSILLFSCTPYSAKSPIEPEPEIIRARITYYDCSQDQWGSRVSCQKTPRAKLGITVAAHPDFDFGQKIYIPELKGVIGDGHFIVQDRGSAVTKKKASKKLGYVFDIYCNSARLRKTMAKENAMWMDVEIVK